MTTNGWKKDIPIDRVRYTNHTYYVSEEKIPCTVIEDLSEGNIIMTIINKNKRSLNELSYFPVSFLVTSFRTRKEKKDKKKRT